LNVSNSTSSSSSKDDQTSNNDIRDIKEIKVPVAKKNLNDIVQTEVNLDEAVAPDVDSELPDEEDEESGVIQLSENNTNAPRLVLSVFC
jgi:hypothetical protein